MIKTLSVVTILIISLIGIYSYFSPPKQADNLNWVKYDKNVVEQATDNNQPVILYFSANWCPPCIEFEKSTFKDEVVIRTLNSFTLEKIDWTNYDSVGEMLSDETETLNKEYGVIGIPTMIFIDSEGREVKDSRITGYLRNDELLSHVQKSFGSN